MESEYDKVWKGKENQERLSRRPKMPEEDGWGKKAMPKTTNHTKEKAQYRREDNQAKSQVKANHTREEIQQNSTSQFKKHGITWWGFILGRSISHVFQGEQQR